MFLIKSVHAPNFSKLFIYKGVNNIRKNWHFVRSLTSLQLNNEEDLNMGYTGFLS